MWISRIHVSVPGIWHLKETCRQWFPIASDTHMNSWGKPYAPFLDNKRSNSGQVEVKYHHPRLQGWEFTGAVAADAGSLYGDNVGFSLSVCKRGILKSWK